MKKLINEFDIQYKEILKKIREEGFQEKNKRTGHICQSIAGAHMQFDLEKGFPLLTLRKIPLKIFIAEQVWFLQGKRELDFLQQYTKIWDDFADKGNIVSSAYGYRWRKHFQRDQIEGLLQLLSSDQSSRHGVILMWDPSDDGLANGTKKKNVPCPFTFTVQVIGGRLCLHLVIRSNDMMLGNPHDVAGFALLNYFLAEKLNIPVGLLTISISNAHIYDIHFQQADEIITRSPLHPPIPFLCPKNAFIRAENGDHDLVDECFKILLSNYSPQESVGKMNIVL